MPEPVENTWRRPRFGNIAHWVVELWGGTYLTVACNDKLYEVTSMTRDENPEIRCPDCVQIKELAE